MRMDKSYSITKSQYDYLLPVFGVAGMLKTRLLTSNNRYYFIGSYIDYLDMLSRCFYL